MVTDPNLSNNDSSAVFGIIPPFMIDEIINNGNVRQQRWAKKMQKFDVQLRDKRNKVMNEQIRHGETHTLAAASIKAGKQSDKSNITIYNGLHKAELPGQEMIIDNSADKDAASAYNIIKASYDLFDQVYNRRSLDGLGMPVLCTVHHRRKYQNAFWNGKQAVCGDGDGEVFMSFARDTSVLAHELGHGVIQFCGGLRYNDQSGALNEHIADVFGAITDQRQKGQSAQEASWLIGGDILGPNIQGKALRSMSEPGTAYNDPVIGKDRQPYHIRDYVLTTSDYGGVHINSGIPNHAFYLLCIIHGGHSWQAPGQIWYRALQNLNDPNATFNNWAEETVQAAMQLFGSGSRQVRITKQAWKLVGL